MSESPLAPSGAPASPGVSGSPDATAAPGAPGRPDLSTPVLIQFGRYTIHRLLGVGGMAEIYQATVFGPEGFEKPVVIKRVRSQYALDETFVRMFADEAKICASLNHANLVSVHDFGQEAGHYYMAMEFIDGLDLRAAHVRHAQRFGKPLPWQVSTLVLRDVLRGLDYAHKLTDPLGRPMGIVHRDIDLANVMVRRDGAVKVLDFGCAKAASFVRRTETVAGTIKGKLGYMSPEQAEDRDLDPRSDVWAAGVVLHELCTGRRLFYGEDAVAVIRSVLGRPIPDPGAMNPEVPEVLSRIVFHALERDRERRFPSAGAMADALEEVILEHRIPTGRIAEVIAPLMDDPAALAGGLTAGQRKITLAAWAESTADAEPLEVVSGVLLDDGKTEVESAPFIDATILTTNPRWHFPEELSATGGRGATAAAATAAALAPTGERVITRERAAVELTPPAEAPGALHERRTEILQVAAPAAGLHAEETQLLDRQRGAPGAPPAGLYAEETQLLAAEGEIDLGARLEAHETALLSAADRGVAPPGPRPPEEAVPLTHPKPAERPPRRPGLALLLLVGLSLAVIAAVLALRYCF